MTRTLYDSLIAHAKAAAHAYPSRRDRLIRQIAGIKAHRRYYARIGRPFFVKEYVEG